MLKFFRETKAYVSIFLCLVLLPMVTYSAMIIDAIRLQSARVQVQSAGDLALNAAMSEYEQVLEDMYGLFANAKSKNDVEPAMRRYFEETISGVINNENTRANSTYVKKFADELTDYAIKGITDMPKEDELTNFLQMQLAEDTDSNKAFSFAPVENSAITNPNIMKGQIIDYMKYKAPVSIGSNFLNKLGFLKDTKNQSEAVQEKVTLTQEIAKMDDPMKAAYETINIYNIFAGEYNKGYNQVTYNNSLATIENEMRTNFDDMIYYLLMRDNVLAHWEKYFEVDFYSSLDTSTYADLKIENTISFSVAPDAENITAAQIITELDKILDVLKKIKDVTDTENQTVLSDFENLYGQIYINYVDNADTGLKDASTIEYNSYSTASKDTIPTIKSLNQWKTNISNCDTNTQEGIKSKHDFQIEYLKNVEEYKKYKAYHEYFQNLYVKYCEYMDAYQKLFQDPITDADYKKYDNYHITLTKLHENGGCLSPNCEQKQLLEEFISNIIDTSLYWDKAEECYKNALKGFQEYYNRLSNVELHAKDSVEALDTLIKQLDTVQNQVTTCKSSIENVEDEAAKSQMASDIESLAKSVKIEDVQNLKGILEGIEGKFKSLRENAKKVEFLGYKVYQLWESEFEKNYYENNGNEKNSICIKLGFVDKIDKFKDLNELKQEFEKKNKNRHQYDSIVKNGVIDKNVPASVELITGNRIDGKDCFYTVLKNTAEAKPPETQDEKQQKSQNNLNTVKSYATVADGQPAQTVAIESSKKEPQTTTVAFPAELSGKETDFKAVHTEINPGGSKDYGSAGSASVPDKDAKSDDANGDAEKGKENLANANGLLESIANIANNIQNDVYLEEYFTEMFTCLTDKKLGDGELQLINGYSNNPQATRYLNTKNEWYGSEIEYILWGKDELQKNLDTTAMTIFLLRFAINAVYAFTASDIQSMASAMANLLVGWTVVLVPVVQVCIVLAIALAESALDLEMLKNGEDVPLIKDKTTFICSPTGLTSNITDKIVNLATDKITDYVTDKVDEAIDEIVDIGEKKIKDCEAEVNQALSDYLNQQVTSITTAISSQFTGPLVNSMTPMISKLNYDANNVVTNAEALARETVNSVFTTIKININNMDGGITKTFALKAFDAAENEKEDLINKIKQEIQKSIDSISAESLIELIDNKVEGWITSIKTELETELKKTTDNMAKEIMSHGEDAATSLKGYMHEQIGNVS